MFPNVLAFPREHWHGPDSSTYLGRDVDQISIDLAAIQNAIEKLPLVRCQIEQERELFPAERYGFLDPRIDVSLFRESVTRQANRELLTEFARIALDGVDRHGPPIAPPAGPDGQHGGLDQTPVESVDRQDATRIE